MAGKITSVAKNDTEPTRAFILGHVFNHGRDERREGGGREEGGEVRAGRGEKEKRMKGEDKG